MGRFQRRIDYFQIIITIFTAYTLINHEGV